MAFIQDLEFKNLIPPLAREEYEQLEENILKEGIREPIILWNDIIIDGNNRYKIAQAHNLEYKTISMEFNNRDDVIDWIINNQLGRRNLTKEAMSYLRGLQYRRDKKKDPFKGNQYTQSGDVQNEQQQTTAEKLADQHNVSKDTIRRDEKYADAIDEVVENTSPEVKEQIFSGEINTTQKEIKTIAKLEPIEQQQAVEEIKSRPHVTNNSGNNDWYTPIEFINIARETMQEIHCDPASSDIANKTVKAITYYDIDNNGLDKEWKGNVWMNPPYSQPLIQRFCTKLIEEINNGNTKQACVLVNNATETAYFQTLLASAKAIWFIKSRVKFIDMNGKPSGSPLQGQCLLYFGENIKQFKELCTGIVYER